MLSPRLASAPPGDWRRVWYIWSFSTSSRNLRASSGLSNTQVSPLVTLIPAPSSTLSVPAFPSFSPGLKSFLALTEAASVKVR
ncbi:hypothetical protein [Streptomyces sp. NPDC087437]|uniref:hypothetical protein n=1 Tax=Streptomyces sp. NPDC087437 TaxID=3365789 RepID=UPI00382A6B9A